tara:strand:- start:1109 stop:2782 length:1674 start_codon:yes stop_codon:yes gene_type:complete
MNRIIVIIMIASISFAHYPKSMGKNGVVSSSSSHASDIGIQVLKNGGNAVDAAIAVGFALGVTFPNAGNIGGGGFMVIRLSNGEVSTIDFREVAPLLSDRDMFLDDSSRVIRGKSLYTALASGVPGTVAGFGYAHEKYGTKSWKSLIEPSINLAYNGFRLTTRDADYLNDARKFLSRDKEALKIFVPNKNHKVGDLLIQTDLANTLKRISTYGYKEFYEGLTSKKIIKCMNRTNGIISKEDLLTYEPVERKPIEFTYRGYKIYSMPPASSGGICLAEILNQIETTNLRLFDYQGPEHIQLVVEAEKRAYADRAEYMGDIDFVDVPINRLISNQYAEMRFSDFDFDVVIPSNNMGPGLGPVLNESSETTHYSIVDKWGNAVSVTTTLNGKYGNGIVVDDAGFLLNNEMDDFSIKPGHPNKYGLVGKEANSIKPKKRMLSSMTPTIVENSSGELILVLGSPGGSTIITTVAQIIINIIDYDMSISDAVQAPRFHHQWLPDVVFYEEGAISNKTMNTLKNKGYIFHRRKSIGEANCIQIPSNGIIFGAADSRREASTRAY